MQFCTKKECFETKVLRSLDEILDRQKKLEEQVANFSLTPGDLDDLLEDIIPKPINSEQEFDRLGMELQETVYRRKMVTPIA
jgi:SHS2 domain-containing protein